MYKIRLTISLLLLVTSLSFAQDLDFQKNTSGAKMAFVDDKLYSDQVIVKFKEHIIEFQEGVEFVTGLDIKPGYSNIINTFQSICDREGLLPENIMFYQAISGCKPGQRTVYSPQKRCLVTVPDLSLAYIIQFPTLVDVQSVLKDLHSLSELNYAHQPVQTIEYESSPPNDPEYLADKQWYLNKVEAQNAWNISRGSNEVKLAVIDQSGVKSSHVDLSSKYVGGDGDISYDLQSSHGTKIAGVAAAATNNNIGIASLGWNTSLLTYRFTSEDENRENLANDIKDAADDGADVMVMCFGTSKRVLINGKYWKIMWNYSLVEEAVQYAGTMGVAIVAAAGNNSPPDQWDEIPFHSWPAEYPNVIGVSATNSSDNFIDGWNYSPAGTQLIDVAAPGYNIYTTSYTTNNNDTYVYDLGTSYSAPLVAALASLIIAVKPNLTSQQVQSIIISTADKVGQYSYDANGWNQYMGYGRINAYQALNLALAYDNRSTISAATAYNSPRILAREKNSTSTLHEVFYSGAWSSSWNGWEVFYRRSSDNGARAGILLSASVPAMAIIGVSVSQ